jgi:hypothetical protein
VFSEDYRWPIWRAKLPAPLFKLFNLGFIGEPICLPFSFWPTWLTSLLSSVSAIFQNLLLLAIAVPSYYLLVQAHPTTYNVPKLPSKFANELKTSPYLTKTDYALAAAAILCVYGEYLSDNIQQGQLSRLISRLPNFLPTSISCSSPCQPINPGSTPPPPADPLPRPGPLFSSPPSPGGSPTSLAASSLRAFGATRGTRPFCSSRRSGGFSRSSLSFPSSPVSPIRSSRLGGRTEKTVSRRRGSCMSRSSRSRSLGGPLSGRSGCRVSSSLLRKHKLITFLSLTYSYGD